MSWDRPIPSDRPLRKLGWTVAGLVMAGVVTVTSFGDEWGDVSLSIEREAPSPVSRSAGDEDGDDSVWDELGPNHGLFSGLVPDLDELGPAGREDEARDDPHQDENVPHPVSNVVDDDRLPFGVDDEDDADVDPSAPADGEPEELEPGESCSGIAHLLPGGSEAFASGVWVWNADGVEATGRWVWMTDQPDHPCFDEDAGSDLASPHDVDLHTFVADYGAARSVGHVDWLLEMTHPAVRSLFGDESCREVLAHSPWAVLATEVVDVGRADRWLFEYESGVVTFPAAISANVDHTFHDGGEATFPWTVPLHDGQAYLAYDCDLATP